MCLGLNGSFDFAEGLASGVGAKANVPLWVDNCFKKCAEGKKLKTLGRLECRHSGLVNISFFCPFTMVYFSIFLCRCLSLTLGGNGRGYVQERTSGTRLYPTIRKIEARRYAEYRTAPALEYKPLLANVIF